MASDRDDIIRKVNALLRQAEDPAATPEEAKTFSAAAQRLIAKYAIEEAILRGETTSGRGEPGITEIKIKINDLTEASMQLCWAVVRFERCRAINSKVYGADYTVMEIVGFKNDREVAQLLFQSLGMQALTEMMGSDVMKGKGPKKAKATSFFLGYIEEIKRRFREATRLAQQDVVNESGRSSESVALALISDKQKIEEWIAQHYGRLGVHRSSVSINSAAYAAGAAAGRRADLGGGKVGGCGRKELG